MFYELIINSSRPDAFHTLTSFESSNDGPAFMPSLSGLLARTIILDPHEDINDLFNRLCPLKNPNFNSLILGGNLLHKVPANALRAVFNGLTNVTLLDLRKSYLDKQDVNYLTEAFSGIRENVQTLHLPDLNLAEKSLLDITRIFAALPRTLNALHLVRSGLGDNAERTTTVLSQLPPHLTSLDLSNNVLLEEMITPRELTQAFENLPISITALGLRESFDDTESEQIPLYTAAIPRRITTLDFSNNDLGYCDSEDIRNTFAAMPYDLTSLNLHKNRFNQIQGDDLRTVFTTLPNSLNSLDLSHNGLAQTAVLGECLGSLPRNLASLSLSDNDLGNLSGLTLENCLRLLPPNLTSLNLSKNSLYKLSGGGLQRLFMGISPLGDKFSLNFSNNNLNKLATHELVEGFNQLPENIISIDLSHNELYKMSSQDLRTLLESIPKHVKSINLQHNKLFAGEWVLPRKTAEEIDTFLQELGDVRFRSGLDITHNGEAEFSRIIVPLVSMTEHPSKLPEEILATIANFASNVSCRSAYMYIHETLLKHIDNIREESETKAWMELIDTFDGCESSNDEESTSEMDVDNATNSTVYANGYSIFTSESTKINARKYSDIHFEREGKQTKQRR